MTHLVIDPELIKTLNAMSGYHDDSDHLEDSSSSHQELSAQSDRGFLSKVASVPYNLAVGAGGGIQNLGHGLLPSVISKFEPHGLSQKIGELLGNIASFSGGGLGLKTAAEAVPLASKAIELGKKTLPTILSRLVGAATYGAINEPEDRLKGAKTGLIFGALGETIPGATSGLGKVAEFLYPQKYTNELVSSIRNNYLKTRQEASNLYKPVINQLGENRITNYPNYSQYRKLGKDFFDVYPAKLKDIHNEFIQNPTLKNAHELQSRIGKTLSKYVSKNESQSDVEKLTKLKELIQNDINRFLSKKSPGLSLQYKNASNFYRENVVPFGINKTINEISSGNVKTIEPQKLHESLRKLSEKEDVLLKHHMLAQSLQELAHRMSRGKASSTAVSLGSGMAMPGIGLLGGAVGNVYLMPKLLELATNPTINKNIGRMRPYYDALVKSLIMTHTGNS